MCGSLSVHVQCADGAFAAGGSGVLWRHAFRPRKIIAAVALSLTFFTMVASKRDASGSDFLIVLEIGAVSKDGKSCKPATFMGWSNERGPMRRNYVRARCKGKV